MVVDDGAANDGEGGGSAGRGIRGPIPDAAAQTIAPAAAQPAGAAGGLVLNDGRMVDGADCAKIIDDTAARAGAAVAAEDAAGPLGAAGAARGLVEDELAVGDIHGAPRSDAAAGAAAAIAAVAAVAAATAGGPVVTDHQMVHG